MSNLGTALASGTRASLSQARERTRNETPAGIGTPVTLISAAATASAGAGYSDFVRSTGSFTTDGFFPGQKVTTSGFGTAANNGTWVVHAVTATNLTVRDTSDVITDETAATAQAVEIRMETLRATGRNVNLEKNILESQEVDPDGQETDSRHGFNQVVGSPGFQLSRADYDDSIEFTMGSAWAEDIGVTSSPNLGVDGSGRFERPSGGSFIDDGFRPGDIVRTTGFSVTGNNADWRVTAVDTLLLTVVATSDGTSTPTSETLGGSKDIALPGKRIDVGTDLCTVLIERAFADIAQYQVFNGVAYDQWQLTVEPESIINGTFNLLGMSAAALASSQVGNSNPLGSSGNSPFAAFDGEIYEGGSRIAVATSLDFTLSRNRSLNPVIGSRFSPDVFEGTAQVAGNLTAYFENATLFNKFVNETESSIWLRFDDPNDSTQFFNIVFPRVKYNGATLDPPQEGPIPLEMPFIALKKTGLAIPGGNTINTLMTVQVSNDLDS